MSDLNHKTMADTASQSEEPIGVFDSGVGGLTVFRAIERKLPSESLVYLGDTARIPYGTRSVETVERYAKEDAQFIESRNVKAIVIACNTASALATTTLRAQCRAPLIGVIGPGARRAVSVTRNGRIGVVATEATVSSGAYERAMKEINKDVEVVSRACPLFVPLAEEGWVNHEVTRLVAEEYLAEFRYSGVDTLVLGCTHYPILRPMIEQVVGSGVRYIDSGEAVADELALLLKQRGLLKENTAPRNEEFFVTDSAKRFRRVAELFLGRPLDSIKTVRLGEE